MSIVKVIEVIGEGKSIEKAIESIVAEAEKTLKNVRQVDVKHTQAIVEKKKIAKYRVNAHVSFVVEH